MFDEIATIRHGEGPVLAIAIHNGHHLRRDAVPWMLLQDADRLREEDPWTGEWTAVGDSRIVAYRSRFEVDLNRPREMAVYRHPDDAWGLSVWSPDTPEHFFEDSLKLYDRFYRELRTLLDTLVSIHGQVVILDLHTYNHRRGGPAADYDDPAANPEINVGTGTMFRPRWALLVDRFLDDLRRCRYRDRCFDVRENVRFRGGHLPLWVHTEYPESVCAVAIEVKKFFMDEWTGIRDEHEHSRIMDALRSTLPGLREELANARQHHQA
jgi:N-formylglutamate amidohydrolase